MQEKEPEKDISLKTFLGDVICIGIALCGAGTLVVLTKITDYKKKRKPKTKQPLFSKED